jgi:excisionase family DNA binding protein
MHRAAKGKTISEVITKPIFEPLLDSVQAAKLLGGIRPNAELKEIDDRYRCILDYIEAAGDETFAFEPLLSADEAAELLGMHVNTVRLWARDGKIPCFRLGRRVVFRTSALNRLFDVPYTGHAVLIASTERKAA